MESGIDLPGVQPAMSRQLQPHSKPILTQQTRRLFLQRLALLGAATAGSQLLAACSSTSSADAPSTGQQNPTPTEGPRGTLTADHVEGRILVIIELEGGNDGLSTVIPADSKTYYDLRPQLAIDPNDVIALNDRVGLNPRLQRLKQRGVTIVEGVGAPEGDLSHFEMSARWQQGDLDGNSGLRTGFGGRLSDALYRGSPATGVSLGGPAPFLLGRQTMPLSFEGLDDLWTLQPTEWSELSAFQEAIGSFNSGLVSRAYGQLLSLGEKLASVEGTDIDWDDPMLSEGGSIGQQLFLASDVIEADIGTRILYTHHGGFDTHDDHRWQHDYLMSELDAALGGFLDRAETLGFADRVVVATVSEFGRRIRENNGGLDHGTASVMLVTGAIEPRILGEPVDLGQLDENGNPVITTSFDRYFASLAQEWLGIDASSVLPSHPEPLGLL